jgi:LexA-binding, inner membrane-associated putative hydrolase
VLLEQSRHAPVASFSTESTSMTQSATRNPGIPPLPIQATGPSNLGTVNSQRGKANVSLEQVRDDRLFYWAAATAAKRWVGGLLALYALATDWLTGWHGMNFAMRGLLDWPAHLATALVILGALVRVRRRPPEQQFGWTMLACSVVIDIDHLPAEFGSYVLTNGTPRPYTHAFWVVIVLTIAWATARFSTIRLGRPRPATVELILAGAAWGVAAHFVRDIATAPMSFWWPVTKAAVEAPYWSYVLALAIIIAVGPIRSHPRSADFTTVTADNRRSTIRSRAQ